jgi:hypothetical protein
MGAFAGGAKQADQGAAREVYSGAGGESAMARDSLDTGVGGGGEEIDWRSALMPQLRELQEENRQLALM